MAFLCPLPNFSGIPALPGPSVHSFLPYFPWCQEASRVALPYVRRTASSRHTQEHWGQDTHRSSLSWTRLEPVVEPWDQLIRTAFLSAISLLWWGEPGWSGWRLSPRYELWG